MDCIANMGSNHSGPVSQNLVVGPGVFPPGSYPMDTGGWTCSETSTTRSWLPNPADEYKKHVLPHEMGTRKVRVVDLSTGEEKEVDRVVIAHRAIERLAMQYGVEVRSYAWQSIEEGTELVIITVGGLKSRPAATAMGEDPGHVNNDTPRLRAWKLAFDRAVLMHLGIDAISELEPTDG